MASSSQIALPTPGLAVPSVHAPSGHTKLFTPSLQPPWGFTCWAPHGAASASILSRLPQCCFCASIWLLAHAPVPSCSFWLHTREAPSPHKAEAGARQQGTQAALRRGHQHQELEPSPLLHMQKPFSATPDLLLLSPPLQSALHRAGAGGGGGEGNCNVINAVTTCFPLGELYH